LAAWDNLDFAAKLLPNGEHVVARRKGEWTEKTVAALKESAWDADSRGLGVRVHPTGRKQYILGARMPGQKFTRIKLGEVGIISLAEAREKAQRWRRFIADGIDPREEEKRLAEARRLAQARKRATTLAAVARRFIETKLSAERRGGEVERIIRRELLPELGDRPIAEISKGEIKSLIEDIVSRGAPYTARHTLEAAKRLFSWAVEEDDYGITASPVDRLKPKTIIGEKKPRKRVLNDEEIFAFWRAVKRLPEPYRPALQLLLLTGARHREVTEMRWREVKGSVWTVPAERFKSDSEHIVPLSDGALAVLSEIPRFKRGDYVFSTTGGKLPTVISDKIKRRLDALMLRTLKALARKRGEDAEQVELAPWVIHDLRRTLRTGLAKLRVSDDIAEMAIGHGREGLERVYNQHRYLDEIRDALERWSCHVIGIVQSKPGKVVALRAVS
jgi:integrase